MAIRRTLSLASLALAAALLSALSAPAYLIILKDGTRLEAAEKPVEKGRNFLFKDKLGARKMIAITEVDSAKTDVANSENYRDAYILGDPAPMKKESETTAKAPSLSEFIRQKGKSDIPLPTPASPVNPNEPPTTQGSERSAQKSFERPAGPAPGNVLDPVVQDAFLRAYQSASVRGVRITQGGAGTIRVQAVTDAEAVVFGALVGTARGLKEARTAGRLVDQVELYMATSAGENAGKFVITPEHADSLLNGSIPPAKFFVANVQL
ncbi:MAG TPA: hypothetical protein VE129_11500 [Thermoanaerobaculia bacterium]|nr:hypothetical protein [Thermoanaerobaculia bacterium]